MESSVAGVVAGVRVESSVGGTGDVPSAPAGVRRSTHEHKPVVNYKLGMTRKKYAFAAMELVTTEFGLSYCNHSYQHDAEVACSFMQLSSLKSDMKQLGTNAEDAGVKEVSQWHRRDTFVPNTYSNLTDEEKQMDLESLMLVVKKRSNKVKARMVAGGNTQQDYLTKVDPSSPTVSNAAAYGKSKYLLKFMILL